MVKPSCGKPGIPFPPEKGSEFFCHESKYTFTYYIYS
jgi:hypothetical protein